MKTENVINNKNIHMHLGTLRRKRKSWQSPEILGDRFPIEKKDNSTCDFSPVTISKIHLLNVLKQKQRTKQEFNGIQYNSGVKWKPGMAGQTLIPDTYDK